jgi:hypothetical protein
MIFERLDKLGGGEYFTGCVPRFYYSLKGETPGMFWFYKKEL